MAGARGYSIQTNPSLKSPLYTKPTPLQLASYGTYVVALVRNGDECGLKTALSCGLSSNPCNAFGESLLHMICRRGNIKLFNIILHAGCNVQIIDDNGRSPLHYACWATQPNFDIVERLIERDVGLFYMADSRGSLPLAYTRKEHWSAWLEFLESKKNLFWPREGSGTAQSTGEDDRARADPCHSPLTIELASMVASGRIAPTEAQLLMSTQHADAGVDADDDSDDDRDDSVADDETVSSDGNSSRPASHTKRWPATRSACFQHDEILNENEMNDILQSLLSSERRPLKW
jgi:Ankyrin repeats (3 copies)